MLRKERKCIHKMLSLNYIRQKRSRDKNSNQEKVQQIESVMNIVGINPTISVISLNINGLNASIRRKKVLKWTKNQDQTT